MTGGNQTAIVTRAGRAWATYAGAEHGPEAAALANARLAAAVLSGGIPDLPEGTAAEAVPTEARHAHMAAVRIEAAMLAHHGLALGAKWPKRNLGGKAAIEAGIALSRLAAAHMARLGPIEALRIEVGPSLVSHSNGWIEFGLSCKVRRDGQQAYATLPSAIQTALLAISVGGTLSAGADFGHAIGVTLGGSASGRALSLAQLAEREDSDRDAVAGAMRAAGAGAWAQPFARKDP